MVRGTARNGSEPKSVVLILLGRTVALMLRKKQGKQKMYDEHEKHDSLSHSAVLSSAHFCRVLHTCFCVCTMLAFKPVGSTYTYVGRHILPL